MKILIFLKAAFSWKSDWMFLNNVHYTFLGRFNCALFVKYALIRLSTLFYSIIYIFLSDKNLFIWGSKIKNEISSFSAFFFIKLNLYLLIWPFNYLLIILYKMFLLQIDSHRTWQYFSVPVFQKIKNIFPRKFNLIKWRH